MFKRLLCLTGLVLVIGAGCDNTTKIVPPGRIEWGSAEQKTVVANDLKGSWKVLNASPTSSEFSDIIINEDTYQTFLADKKVNQGNWIFTSSTLILYSNLGDYNPEEFTNPKLAGDQLTLTTEHGSQTWQRIK